MRALTSTWFGALAALALLGGCSAIVREVDVTCENDCRALNDHEGLGDDACFIYQCRTDQKGCEKRARDKDGDGVPDALTCADAGVAYEGALDCDDSTKARRPDASEECNGEDDDCDGVIDEGALEASFANERERKNKPDLVLDTSPDWVAFGANEDGVLDLVLRYPRPRRDILELRRETYVSVAMDGACEGEGIVGCDFNEMAIASTATMAVVAGVNVIGCGTGQVRVGASLDRKTFTWQHATDSALRFGVDARPGAACSGPPGVSQLSAALLSDVDASQGLLLWRDVRALQTREVAPLRGLAFDLVSEGDESRFVTSSEARSELVSDTRGLERAAVAAWPAPVEGGHFIAYDAQSSIEVAFVPRSRTASALSERLRHGMPIPAHDPRDIALALDPWAPAQAPESLGLGVAWREGDALQFAAITHDPSSDRGPRAGAKVPIGNTGQPLAGPRLVFQRDGFRTGAEAALGGWYVLWVEQGTTGARLLGARIAQADVKAEKPFLLDEADRFDDLFAYPSEGHPQLGVIIEAEQPELHIGSLGCPKQP